MIEDWQNGGFGVYVHWPFCQAKCPYCDFNSHVVARIDHDSYKSAYLSEIKMKSSNIEGRSVTSVFFGGGTPSLMEPDTVRAILTVLRECFSFSNKAEITLEANPTSVDYARFQEFRDAGINRLSLGVQALNNDDLRALGRLHSVEEAQKAWEIAQSCFDRVSIDLIYARQNQSLRDWEYELIQALNQGFSHLSLYQLTIEDGTAFGDRHRRGRLPGLPGEGLAADMYELTQSLTSTAGLPGYEISNHAKDDEASRHNLIYWKSGDFLGIGPGAHGRVTLSGQRMATENQRAPSVWLNEALNSGMVGTMAPISARDHATEVLMMGLRLVEGVDLDRINLICPELIDQQGMSDLRDQGLIETIGDRLIATLRGRVLLNSVLVDLID